MACAISSDFSFSRRVSVEKNLDFDRVGRPRQIADQIGKNAGELRVQGGFRRVDLLAEFVDDVFSRAVAVGAQFHEEVARIGFGNCQGEPGAGPPGETLDLRRLVEDPFDMAQHPISFRETRTGTREVVQHERPLVLLRQEIGLQAAVQEHAARGD